MRKYIVIILVLIGFSSFGQNYLVQPAKWKFTNSQRFDSTVRMFNLSQFTGDTVIGFNPYTKKFGYRVLTASGVTSVSALTLGTSGTDLSSTVANSTTTPVITLNVPTASASNRGALSSTDWATFNAKANDSLVVHLAGTETITGIKTFSHSIKTTGVQPILIDGDGGTNNGGIAIRHATTQNLSGSNYTNINAYGTTGLLVNHGIASFQNKTYIIQASGLTDETTRTYTLPDASGTLALVGGAGGGTVTSVAALTLGTTGTDLSSTVANSTTTPVITLNVPTASAANRGALASADWTTFNNKQSTLSLTTTGNSGSATLVSNTLNVPTYTLAGLGGISLTSLSATTPLSYNNTTGAFSIQVANTSQDGYLSSTDWSTFNGKLGSLTAGNGIIVSGSTIYADTTKLASRRTPTFLTNITTPLIIGGTGTTSSLTYKTTSEVGTTGADHIFQVGNNGAKEAMRILNSGNSQFGVPSGSGQTLKMIVTGSAYGGAIESYRNTSGLIWSLSDVGNLTLNHPSATPSIIGNGRLIVLGSTSNGTVSFTGNQKIEYLTAPTITANYGLVSLGSGAFDGATAGFFKGGALGTLIAGNLVTVRTPDLLNLQVAGVSKIKIDKDGNHTSVKYYVAAMNTAPSSASDTGTLGEIRITATYIYVCTATNTWVRTALATW
jgi:hypothetical protein